MNKFTIGVIILILAAFGGMIIYSTMQNKESAVDYSQYDAAKIITDTEHSGGIAEHVRGKVDSEVVVVEYADFQCPGCKSFWPKVETMYDNYKDEVAFVFRNYPISGHQNARSAAMAAEAAGKQGYFWEMADTLYTNQADWYYETGDSRTNVYIDLFKNALPDGDVEAFKSTMATDETLEKKINWDINIGKELNKVAATPSFYVNGDYVSIGANDSLDDFYNNIEAKIKEKLAATENK